MKISKFVASAAFVFVTTSVAFTAQAFDPYAYVKTQATFHYFDLEANKDDPNIDDTASAIEARAGYMFNPFFGAEARLGVGLTDAKLNRQPNFCYTKANIPFYSGAYGRFQVPLGNSAVTPYALAGLTHMRTKISDSCGSTPIVKGSNTEFAYGAGLDFNYSAYTAGVEVMQHQDDLTSIGVNLGVNLAPRFKGYTVRKTKPVKMKPLKK